MNPASRHALPTVVTGHATPLTLARAAMLPALCIGVIVYAAFHAIAGNNGILAWQAYRVQHTAVSLKASRVSADKAALARQVDLLDPRHVDRDLADELVRRELGVVRPDEVILSLPDAR